MKIKYHNYHINKWIEMSSLCPCCGNELNELVDYTGYNITNELKPKRKNLFCKKCNYEVAFDYDDIELIKDDNKKE